MVLKVVPIFVILKAFYPLVLTLHLRASSAYIFIKFDVAVSWIDYILVMRFTIYALPLTKALPSVFGSD